MAKSKRRRRAGKTSGRPPHRQAPPQPTGGEHAARTADMFAAAVQHHAAGRVADAERLYREILAIDPRHADSLCNLGVLTRQTGRGEMSVALFAEAVQANDRSAMLHNNLGVALKERGDPAAAAVSYRRALALAQDFAEAHNNLGNALQDLADWAGAVAAHARALTLKPDYAEAHNSLGNALKAQGRVDEAFAAHARAIALRPDYPEAHNNLGHILADQGKRDEAQASYERAVALKPDFAEPDSSRLFCLSLRDDVSMETLLAEHRRWDERHDRYRGAPLPAHANDRDPLRRLRIGYVSADFRNHPVGWYLRNVWSAHNRSAVEVFGYYNGPVADEVTDRLTASADHWRNIVGLADDEVAATIRQDGIDILVDLSGHTAWNRLPLFTHRAAPIQASWLGYPGTTGLASIDYLIMDEAAVPPGSEQWCSEAVVRLPLGRFCYAPPDYAPEVAPPPSLSRVYTTFGSFNNLTKVGPEVVRLWAQVLAAAAGSKLLLKWKTFGDPSTRQRFLDAFAAHEIGPERLELRGVSPHPRMLVEYGDIDIALDPFPFCGGLTSCEALWMGVPVVTLPGDRPASRQTLGFLTTLGLTKLAASSETDYIRIAAELAADPSRLAGLRQSLRPAMAASPLTDGRLFTPTLEAAFRTMWRRWCAGEPAAGFDVGAEPS